MALKKLNVLVLNAGSSSLRFDVFEVESEKLLAGGKRERVTDSAAAAREALEQLKGLRVDAVGHRIVHGGERFRDAVLIDSEVEEAIGQLAALAPLHNPHNLAAYREARKLFPGVPHVAVFDTAFHQTMPACASTYALPRQYREDYGIRRYGFHGISHRSVALRFPGDRKIISCHLGNGCSVCAIDSGRSVDTSMGFTPLEGLVMGTRSGDLDPGALLHLMQREGLEPAGVLKVLNSESGLMGLSGVSHDMRDVLEAEAAGNEAATLAVDVFCHRLRKYIGACLAVLNGADILAFTGGMGESSPVIRERVCRGLDRLGIRIHGGLNKEDQAGPRRIGQSEIEVWVVPSGEELLIAQDTARLAGQRSSHWSESRRAYSSEA